MDAKHRRQKSNIRLQTERGNFIRLWRTEDPPTTSFNSAVNTDYQGTAIRGCPWFLVSIVSSVNEPGFPPSSSPCIAPEMSMVSPDIGIYRGDYFAKPDFSTSARHRRSFGRNDMKTPAIFCVRPVCHAERSRGICYQIRCDIHYL